MRRIFSVGMVLMMLACQSAWGGWRDLLDSVLGEGNSEQVKEVAAAALGNDEIAAALKEALVQGTSKAVTALGTQGGFLDDPAVRIPVPESLAPIERGLHALGKDQYADEFVTTMNRAAESAVPVAKDVFIDAVESMTLDDAKQILDGPDDAATTYLRRVGGERMGQRMLPIVAQATDDAGVTGAYKSLAEKAGPLGRFVDLEQLNLDKYVTDKALDGVFALVAAEEQRIRADPLARGTELLKKVFGSK